MNKFVGAGLVAIVSVISTSTAMAQTHHALHATDGTRPYHGYAPNQDPNFTDLTDPNGGYAPNSPKGERAYWDYVNREQ